MGDISENLATIYESCAIFKVVYILNSLCSHLHILGFLSFLS